MFSSKNEALLGVGGDSLAFAHVMKLIQHAVDKTVNKAAAETGMSEKLLLGVGPTNSKLKLGVAAELESPEAVQTAVKRRDRR